MHDQLYHGDNLAIMRGMEAGSVDLIYADPPFGTGKDWGAFVDKRTGDEYLAWIKPRSDLKCGACSRPPGASTCTAIPP